MRSLGCTALLLAALAALPAKATVLSASMTVDNAFTAYLSTDDGIAGDPIGTGNDWTRTYSFSATLTPGAVNYLHILALDQGVIAAFIGEFSLSDAGFEFFNLQQRVLTETADWLVSNTGFGSDYTLPRKQGDNGSGPWGARSGIDPDADWIWRPDDCVNCTAYFTMPLLPISRPQANAPEPASALLFGFALAAMGWGRRRVFGSRERPKDR